jgi:hypothetical protein
MGTSISKKSDVWAMAATIYALCVARYPFMPFDAPHHDSADRAGREEEIKANLDDLVRLLKENVERSLPPILGNQLKRCFESEEERPTAREIADVLQRTYSDLASRKDTLFKTAWQRAEDVACRLDHKGRAPEVSSLSNAEATDVHDLLDKFAEFIPQQLRISLERGIQPTENGGHSAQ